MPTFGGGSRRGRPRLRRLSALLRLSFWLVLLAFTTLNFAPLLLIGDEDDTTVTMQANDGGIATAGSIPFPLSVLKGAISVNGVSDVAPLVATGTQAPRPKRKAKPQSPHPSSTSIRSQTPHRQQQQQQQQLTVTGTPGAAGVAVATLPSLHDAAATGQEGAAIAADNPEIITDAPRHAPDSHEKAFVSTDHIDLTGAPRHAPDSERNFKAVSKANATPKPLVVTQQSAPEQTPGAFASEPPVELVGEAAVEMAAEETAAVRVGRSGLPQSEDANAGAKGLGGEAEADEEIAEVNEAMAALSEEMEAAEQNEVAEAAEAEIEAANETAGEEGAEGVEEGIAKMMVNEAMAVASDAAIAAEVSVDEQVELEPSEALPADNALEAEANDEQPEREEEQKEAAVGTEEGVQPEELDVEESSRLQVDVESGAKEYPAEEEGRAMLPVQGQVEIFEVNAVSKVPPSPRVLEPLSEKYKDLYRLLQNTPLLMTQERITNNGLLRKRISCGGSEVVRWRTWGELRASLNLIQLYETLPARQPHLPALAHRVQNSFCFNHTVYKKQDCEMDRELWADDLELAHWRKPSCAVVGNSGRLRNEHHAAAIDAHDIVIRFNAGKTQNFEHIVGHRSTFRMFNGPYVGPKQGGEVTVAQMRDDALRTWVGHVHRRGVNNTVAYIFDPEFLCHTWDWVGRHGKKPSSGLVGILWALQMCGRGQVSVYGFQYEAYFDKDVRPHYFDWERPKPGREGVHPFAEERQILGHLADAGLLNLFI